MRFSGIVLLFCLFFAAPASAVKIGFEPPEYPAGQSLPAPWSLAIAADGHWEVSGAAPLSGSQCLGLGCKLYQSSVSTVRADYPIGIDDAATTLNLQCSISPTPYSPGKYDPGYMSNGGVQVYASSNYVVQIFFTTNKPYGADFNPGTHRLLRVYFASETAPYIQRHYSWAPGYHHIQLHYDYAAGTLSLRIERPSGGPIEETVPGAASPWAAGSKLELHGADAALDYVSARAYFDDLSIAADAGSLTVVIEPQAAADAGVQWSVDGGPWQDSGATVTGLEPGPHTLTFSSVEGWEFGPRVVDVGAGESAALTAQPGTLPLGWGLLGAAVFAAGIASLRASGR